MRAERVARSEMGPGKPYSKRPAGLTGALRVVGCDDQICCAGTGTADGLGAAPVDTVVVVVVTILEGESFLSGLIIAAVTAAPVPALTAAIIANVALDMVAGWASRGRRVLIVIYTGTQTRDLVRR
jgi:energy-converting hydrogenase Eha subunit B